MELAKGTNPQLCASCGGRISHDARACEFCARVLERADAGPATHRLHAWRWWLLVALCVVLLGALMLRLIVTLRRGEGSRALMRIRQSAGRADQASSRQSRARPHGGSHWPDRPLHHWEPASHCGSGGYRCKPAQRRIPRCTRRLGWDGMGKFRSQAKSVTIERHDDAPLPSCAGRGEHMSGTSRPVRRRKSAERLAVRYAQDYRATGEVDQRRTGLALRATVCDSFGWCEIGDGVHWSRLLRNSRTDGLNSRST
jgi:hypothetical protein